MAALASNELLQRAQAKRTAQLRLAALHTEDFIELAMTHERDGAKLRNAPFHLEWQRLLREHRFVVLQAPVEHAKTQQIAVAKVLHMLGQNPNLRVALISNTSAMAAKILRAVKQQVEGNPVVAEVFPQLRRSTNTADPWNNDAITVARTTISKDPSIQACGAYGPLVGSRLDAIVIDDILDFENTRTPEQRKKLIDWFETTVMTRATSECRIFCIGTPWHPDDLLHVLATRPGFHSAIYSAVTNPDEPPDKWAPLWPEEWPMERLRDKQKTISENVFLRKYLCRTRVDSSGRFRTAWLQQCQDLGKGRQMNKTAPLAPGGLRTLKTFTGVDLGVGRGSHNALTCFFTIAIDDSGRRLVCEVTAGRWTAPEILDRLVDISMRFGSIIGVEDNGAQSFLVQLAEGRVPVVGLTTGGNKHSEMYGVESLAVEMRNNLWIVPSGADGQTVNAEVREWYNEMLHYTPEAHTGDRLMASWIAREIARKHGVPMFGRFER